MKHFKAIPSYIKASSDPRDDLDIMLGEVGRNIQRLRKYQDDISEEDVESLLTALSKFNESTLLPLVPRE